MWVLLNLLHLASPHIVMWCLKSAKVLLIIILASLSWGVIFKPSLRLTFKLKYTSKIILIPYICIRSILATLTCVSMKVIKIVYELHTCIKNQKKIINSLLLTYFSENYRIEHPYIQNIIFSNKKRLISSEFSMKWQNIIWNVDHEYMRKIAIPYL